MIKNLILLFSIILFFTTDAEAQTPTPKDSPCESEIFCKLSNLEGYKGQITTPTKNPNLFIIPKGFCGSVESPSWFKFIAETPTLDLQFNYYTCGTAGKTGFQAAVFSTTNCNDSLAYSLKSNCMNLDSTKSTGILNAQNLVKGEVYYLFIDGLSGSNCSYDIKVLNTTTIKSIGLSDLPAPSTIYGPIEICSSSTSAVFSVPKNPSATSYNFTASVNGGPPIGGSQVDSFYKFMATLPAAGIITVTANYANNCPLSGPITLKDVNISNQTTIQLPPITLNFGESIVKYGETFDYTVTPLKTTSSQDTTFVHPDVVNSTCDTIFKINVTRLAKTTAGKVYFLRPNETITLGGTTYTVTASNCNPIITSGNDTIYNAVQTYTVSPSNNVTLNCNSAFFSIGKTDSCANTLHYKTYDWNTIDNGVYSSLGLTGRAQGFNSASFDSIGVIVKDSVLINGKPGSGYKIYFDTLQIRLQGVGSADVPPKPSSINGLIPAVTTACQNDVVTYKLSSRTPLATTYTWTLLRGGGTILSAQGDTSINVKWGSLVKKDTIRVVAKNVCHTSQPTDLVVNIGTFPNLTAGVDDSICGTTFNLKGVSGGNMGNWTSLASNPAIPSIQNSASPTTSVTISTSGTYNFAWTEMGSGCKLADTVAITFNPMPMVAVGSLKDSCSATRSQAYVRFNIASGTPPFQVFNTSNNTLAGTVSTMGGQFQSTAFVPGNYSYKIVDAKKCTPALVTGTQACTTCTTNAGNMQAGNFSVCQGDSVKATYLNGFTLEPDDTLQFVLHTGDPKTGIVARSYKPNFAFQSGMTYGITYFISAIAGNRVGTAVDLTDGCFNASTAKIVSVIFNKKPTAVMTVVDSNLCSGSCANISFALSGQAPFTITSKIASPISKDSIFSTSLTKYNFSYCPKVNSSFRLYAVKDATGCVDSVSVSKTVNFTVFPPVSAGLDTSLTVCQGVDTTFSLPTLLRGGALGGTWTEISPVLSVGAFNPFARTFRTRNQANRVYTLQYVVNPTPLSSPCPPDTMTVAINIQFTPKADAGIDDIITCARPIVLIGGNTQLGTGITLQWSSTANNLGGNAPQQEVSQAASYILTATAGGCFSRDTVVIKADTASPKAIILPVIDSITCKKGNLALDGSASLPAGIVYLWSYNGAPYDNNPKSTARFGGTYMLTVSKLTNGCSHTDSIKIKENRTLPTIFIEPTIKLNCKDTIVTLDASQSSQGAAYQIKWKSTQRGHFKSDSTTYQPKVDSAGIYILTITDSRNGCVDSLQRTVIGEYNVPIANAFAKDTLDCYHPTVNLSARGSSLGVGLTYRWIANPGFIVSGDNTVNAIVSEPGKYYFIATNEKTNCSAIDSVLVFKNSNRPQNIALTTNKPTCYGEQNGSLVINGISGGTPPYLYSLDGKVYTPRKSFTNLNAGAFKLYVQDASGCIVDTAFNIVQDRQIGVSLGLDTLLKLGDSILLQVGVNIPNVKRVVWSTYSDSTCRRDSTCMQQWVKPTRQTTYNVQVRDANGCMAEGAINVSINKNRPVFIPTAFSPNNDGTNDIFMIFGSKVIKVIKRFQVYDRWGELIVNYANFAADDPNFGWNGTINGKQAIPAVYSYFIEIEYLDGQAETIKGDVTLMR